MRPSRIGKQWSKNQTRRKIKRFYTDNGLEFCYGFFQMIIAIKWELLGIS